MASRPDYVFTRDFLDNSRLNLTHYLWTKSMGYVLHPQIPTENENLRVVDVGTGTGMFLLDMGEKLPISARLDGLDVSLDAAPPPEVFPSNITLRKWNVRDPVPEDLVGVYDIVHIRFFVFVVLKEEVPSLVEKLVKLLKPGGYLQWVDSDNSSVRAEKTKPENETKNTLALMDLLRSQAPNLDPTWVPELPRIFSESGLVAVEADFHNSPPHWAFLLHEANLIMHELIYRKTQNQQMAEKLKELIPLVVEETRKGAYLTSDRYTFIGRKP